MERTLETPTAREGVLKYAPLVKRIARGLLRHRQDAEDAEQEAFARILAAQSRFKGRGSFEGWVRRIAVRSCFRLMRRRRWIRWVAADVPEPAAPPPLDKESVALLYRALDRLTDRERAAFILKYQEGLQFSEVAAAMGCREGTARNYAFRASQKLRRLLGGAL